MFPIYFTLELSDYKPEIGYYMVLKPLEYPPDELSEQFVRCFGGYENAAFIGW